MREEIHYDVTNVYILQICKKYVTDWRTDKVIKKMLLTSKINHHLRKKGLDLTKKKLNLNFCTPLSCE